MTTITAVTTFHELGDLRGAWRELEQRTPNACVFQSIEWLLAQTERLRTTRIAVGLAFDGQELVAALPLVADRGRAPVLKFLGSGDRNDILCVPGYEGLAPAVLGETLRVAGRGAVFWGSRVPAWSPLTSLAEGNLEWRGRLWEQDPEHLIEVPTDFGTYLAQQFKSKMRKNLRWQLRRLERSGDLQLQKVGADGDFGAFLEVAARHKFRNLEGVYNTSHLCRANGRAMVQAFAANGGHLRGWDLQLDGCTVAGAIDLVHRGVEWYYLPFMNSDFLAWSPGTTLLYLILSEASQEGLAELNLGIGDEPYKERWGTGSRALRDVLLQPAHQPRTSAFVMTRAMQGLRHRVRRSAVGHRLLSAAQTLTLAGERAAVSAPSRIRGGQRCHRSASADAGWTAALAQAWQGLGKRTVRRERRCVYELALADHGPCPEVQDATCEILPPGRYAELSELRPDRCLTDYLDRWRRRETCFVLRYAGKPVGMAWVQFDVEEAVAPGVEAPPKTAYVYDVCVPPALRDRAPYASLLCAIAQNAVAEGQERVWLWCGRADRAEASATEAAGFSQRGYVDVLWRLGRLRTVRIAPELAQAQDTADA